MSARRRGPLRPGHCPPRWWHKVGARRPLPRVMGRGRGERATGAVRRPGAPLGVRRWGRAFWRTGVAGAVVAGVTVGQWATAGAASGSGASGGGFVLGTAQALSQAIVLAPTTGGLSYSITLAQSLAGFTEGVAQGQSQTLNLGAIGLSLTSQQCNGQPAPVSSKELPQAVTVESGSGGQTQQSELTPGLSGTGIGAGHEQASADGTPSSTATTTLTGLDVPGALGVLGGTATATSEVVDGDARVAQATSEIAQVSLLGGLVVLDGLRWVATQRTGSGAANAASFTIAGLKVAGVAIPVRQDSTSQIATIINTALSPIGFEVELPTMSVNQSDGTVTESPLTIGIDKSALGNEVVGSQLGTVQPLRDVIDKALLGANCQFGVPLLLADIGTGVLAGGGNLNIELGGAQADTNGLAAVNPFGDLGGALGGTLGTQGAAGATTTGGGFGGSASGAGPGGLGGTGAAGTGAVGGRTGNLAGGQTPTRVLTSVACRSLGTAGGGCGGAGDALPVGLAGLAALGAMAAADVFRLRRYRRLNPEEAR